MTRTQLEAAFASAEANSRLSRLHPDGIEHYRMLRASILAGELDFDQAVARAVEYHTEINRGFIPPPVSSASSVDNNPYLYPGTDVFINKLGIRDKRALATAETEITTLRLAQLYTQHPPAPAKPAVNSGGYGSSPEEIQRMREILDGLHSKDSRPGPMDS